MAGRMSGTGDLVLDTVTAIYDSLLIFHMSALGLDRGLDLSREGAYSTILRNNVIGREERSSAA